MSPHLRRGPDCVKFCYSGDSSRSIGVRIQLKSTKVWHLILLQGVVFGLSAGILYAPIVMWLSDWFVARRGLAGGIIFGGSGVGGFVFPLAMGYLLDSVGFRWTLRSFCLLTCVSTMLMPPTGFGHCH